MSSFYEPADTPQLNFLTKWYEADAPYGSNLRMRVFMIAHCGFFMFNLINACSLVLIHHYALGRMSKNPLAQLVLFACCFQMLSCMCSINRYNTDDEFGFFAHAGIATGLIAYTPLNFSHIYLFFNGNGDGAISLGPVRVGYVAIFKAIWVALAIHCWVFGENNWETHDFDPFRNYIATSSVFQLVSIISGLYALKKGRIGFPEGSPLTPTIAAKTFHVTIGLTVLALVFAKSGMPIFQYPATGLTFTTTTITMVVAGEMTFIQGVSPAAGADMTPSEITNLV